MIEKHRIVVQPWGRSGEVADGVSLRAAIRQLGLDVESICAENATCGKCKVLIEDGAWGDPSVRSSPSHVSDPGPEETAYFASREAALAGRGWKLGHVRLACQAKIHGDVVVTVPEESRTDRQIVRKSAIERSIAIKPTLRKYLVEMNPPTLANPKADWERLASGIATSMELVRYGEPDLPRPSDLSIDYGCLRGLAATLRESQWRVTVSVWNDREVVRVEPGYTDRLYGAAVDIGTTTVALYLCDLMTGEIVATESDMNSQIAFGEDVMSRIHFSSNDVDGLKKLHTSIIRTLNQLLVRGAKAGGIATEDVLELTVVGNTTMQHLFLNLPPKSLGAAPVAPTIFHDVDLRARELRLAMNPSGNVHVLPAIASFIGADTTGVLLAEEPYDQDENWLIIDIGTNAELVLGNRQLLLCASTPTGPALEGATIEFGMRAAAGAIEHVKIESDTLKAHWKLIGEDQWDRGQPKGLCGSAVVDAVAELRRTRGLDAGGKLVAGASTRGLIRAGAAGTEYVIATADQNSLGTDLVLTQKDVRQIQLAKGALFVAAESLLSHAGLDAPDKILLAGAFGSFMDKGSAVAIGMLPSLPLERIFVVGNSAGDGARIALLNRDKRIEAMKVATRVVRYELPADPAFQERFIRAMRFPEAPREERMS
jgi:uncharacterized 2Fe-2S/4Fe-4S cluster protein (DUF4445 family)